MRKWIWSSLVILLCLVGVFFLTAPRIITGVLDYMEKAQDPVDRAANCCGVPRERVIDLARTLGVQPDQIDSFGPALFPFNYFDSRIREFEDKNGRPPTQSEVDITFKGYTARCQSRSTRIEYLFYTDKTQGFGEKAMVIAVSFALPRPNEPVLVDPPFTGMGIILLSDASVNPAGETYWERCIQKYKESH